MQLDEVQIEARLDKYDWKKSLSLYGGRCCRTLLYRMRDKINRHPVCDLFESHFYSSLIRIDRQKEAYGRT
jgi:hypothetical protein